MITEDVKKAVKERIESPVFGTFIIVFLFDNWKIPVGIFMPKDMLLKEGYDSYFKLIRENSDLCFPLLVTLVLFIVYPWILKFAENWAKYASAIWGDFFLKRLVYKPQVYTAEQYKEVTEKTQKMYSDLYNAKEDLRIVKMEKEEINNKLTLIENYNSIKFLNGTWETKSDFIDVSETKSGVVNGNLFIFNNYEIVRYLDDGTKIPIAAIESHSYNSQTKRINILIKKNRGPNLISDQFYNYSFIVSEPFLNQGENLLDGNTPNPQITLKKIL